MLPLVSVIVVNWNGKDFLEKCLTSLREQSFNLLEVIMVDNASTDDSVEFVETNFPEVILVKNTYNAGFAEGNNLGVQKAKGKYLFLLNNDAWVKIDTIEKLVAFANSNQEVGIVGCRILNSDGSFQNAGTQIDLLGFAVVCTADYILEREVNKTFAKFFFVAGAAFLIERELYLALKGFDESYFMFCEDADLCWRTRLLGKQVVTFLEAEVFHLGGASLAGGIISQNSKYKTSTRRIYLRERNTLAMLLTNYSLVWLFLILPIYIGLNLGEVLILTIWVKARLRVAILTLMSGTSSG